MKRSYLSLVQFTRAYHLPWVLDGLQTIHTRYFASLICVLLKVISIVFHHSKGSYKHEQWDGFKNEQTIMAVLYEAHSLLPLTDSGGKLSQKWGRNYKERKWSSNSTSEQLTQASMVKKKDQEKQNKNRNKNHKTSHDCQHKFMGKACNWAVTLH